VPDWRPALPGDSLSVQRHGKWRRCHWLNRRDALVGPVARIPLGDQDLLCAPTARLKPMGLRTAVCS